MHNTILLSLCLVLLPLTASAQFYTITEDKAIEAQKPVNTEQKPHIHADEMKKDTLSVKKAISSDDTKTVRERIKRTSQEKHTRQKPLLETTTKTPTTDRPLTKDLPELTLPNLYEEIKRNGILFPKIVLAQAILETGWFRSNACRTKNNLFGLTNPKTGQYFTFGHWTESVRAYYTKVQYRYKGGNYLLWLRNIGYAEDPGYIRAVISVLKLL